MLLTSIFAGRRRENGRTVSRTVRQARSRRREPARGWAAILVAAAAAALLALPASSAAGLRVNGSTTVNPVVVEAAEALRADEGSEITVDTAGGSSGGIAAVAEGRAEIGMASRPLTEEDRRRFPGVDFRSVTVGLDALALVVSRDVWEGGVRSVSPDEIRALYEGRIADWSELGGPDRRVVFFDKEPGRGTWEVFARWLYGDLAKVPLVSLPTVGSNEEARSKVARTRGAITQLSAAWADGVETFALALELGDGRTVTPTPEAVADGSYPLGRPLLIVTDGPPSPEATRLIDLLLSSRGREIVARHGFLVPQASREAPAP